MTYRYYASRRNPAALWILDDTAPFQEQTNSPYVADIAPGSTAPTTAAPLVSGAKFSSVFSNGNRARFSTPFFNRGTEGQSFALEAWVLPIAGTGRQKILSHAGSYDGLTIQGNVIRFSIDFETAVDASCSYDLSIARAAHVVGVYTADQISLYIDGKPVARQDFTDPQKNDVFTTTDGFLYAGESTGTQKVAMNGVAIYSKSSDEVWVQNFAAGRMTVPQDIAVGYFGGQSFDISTGQGSVFLDMTWTDRTDFLLGLNDGVEISDTAIVPSELTSPSSPGTWTCGASLAMPELTSIYGVAVEWSAVGATVEGSIDSGTTWQALQNGRLVPGIISGTDPNSLPDLEVRFTFPGGITDDESFVEYVRIIGYADNKVLGIPTRDIYYNSPAVLRDDYEPIEYRDNNGIHLAGGSLVMNPDTSDEVVNTRTVEYWVKPVSTQVTTSFAGTRYVNGAASAAPLPLNQWSLVHNVLSADSNAGIQFSGDCIIGQVNLYPSALTVPDIGYLFSAYTGRPTARVSDPNATVTVTEAINPAKLYSHDWSIAGAG